MLPCRKLLERARQNVAAEKRLYSASREAHERWLAAFTHAESAGDTEALASMLAEDGMMITDGGAERRRVRGIRNLQVPLDGARKFGLAIRSARTQRAAGPCLLRRRCPVRGVVAGRCRRAHSSGVLSRRPEPSAAPRTAQRPIAVKNSSRTTRPSSEPSNSTPHPNLPQ